LVRHFHDIAFDRACIFSRPNEFSLLPLRPLGVRAFKRGLAIACLLSVTLVENVKLIVRTKISPTPSLFVVQRPTPGEHGEIFGRRGGVIKSDVLMEHKSGNVSETRKDREKVTIMESL